MRTKRRINVTPAAPTRCRRDAPRAEPRGVPHRRPDPELPARPDPEEGGSLAPLRAMSLPRSAAILAPVVSGFWALRGAIRFGVLGGRPCGLLILEEARLPPAPSLPGLLCPPPGLFKPIALNPEAGLTPVGDPACEPPSIPSPPVGKGGSTPISLKACLITSFSRAIASSWSQQAR